jgi:hypothetical protein
MPVNTTGPLKRELTAIWKEDQDIRYELMDAREKPGKDSLRIDSLYQVMYCFIGIGNPRF